MNGWLKIHRELMDKPIWLNSTPEQKVILIAILCIVNHSEADWEWEGEKYHCEPGQKITSIDAIKAKCGKGISSQNVRTALLRFEKLGFLTSKSTNKGRLITIVNWGLYQRDDDKPNNETNRQLTGNSQATNRQLTTNKKNKEEQKEKENKELINEWQRGNDFLLSHARERLPEETYTEKEFKEMHEDCHKRFINALKAKGYPLPPGNN